jgi:hypothetical protein
MRLAVARHVGVGLGLARLGLAWMAKGDTYGYG